MTRDFVRLVQATEKNLDRIRSHPNCPSGLFADHVSVICDTHPFGRIPTPEMLNVKKIMAKLLVNAK